MARRQWLAVFALVAISNLHFTACVGSHLHITSEDRTGSSSFAPHVSNLKRRVTTTTLQADAEAPHNIDSDNTDVIELEPVHRTPTSVSRLLSTNAKPATVLPMQEPAPDMAVTVTATPGNEAPLVPNNQPATFVSTVINNGPGPASIVQYGSSLSAGLALTGSIVAQPDGLCTGGSISFTCSWDNIASGSVKIITYKAYGIATGMQSSSVSVSATGTTGTDPNPGNNQASHFITVQQLPSDMAVITTATPVAAPLQPGNQPVFTFTSTISVAGGDASNVQLSINLSAGLARTGNIVAQPDGTCTSGSNSFTCTWAAVNAGSVRTVVYQGIASERGTQSSTAAVTATGFDPNTGNNQATTSVTVQAPVTVDVTASTNTAVCPGVASLTFRFAYSGVDEPNAAVQLRATLAGATCVVAAPADLTGTTSNVAITARCNLDSGQPFLAGTYSATLAAVITGTPAADSATGTLDVSCSAPGCFALQVCGGPPTTPVVAFALQCPRLPLQIAMGDSLLLVFPVTATGNVAATSLTFTDDLGAGLEFVSALVDYDASACSYTAANTRVTCNLGIVAPGAPAKAVWIVVNVVASPASHSYALTGTTAVNGPITLAATACPLSVPPTDTAVSLSVNPAAATLVPGNQPVFTFTSTVSVAAGRANNAVLSSSLSAGLARTGDIVAQPDGTCTSGSTSFTCSWSNVVQGSPKTVVYQAFAFGSGTQSATAVVTATGIDPTPNNNAASAKVTVQAPTTSGLFTSISAPSPVRTNADFTFTVAAGVAAGSSSSINPLRLVVQLPAAGITVNSVAAPNTAGLSATSAETCVIAGSSITCTWPGDAPPGASELVQVLASVAATSQLTITATASTDTPGVAPATQSVTVTANAAVVQPTSIFADITSPPTRVPINQPFTVRLRGGLTAAGSLPLRLMGSLSGTCSLQMQTVDPDAPVCSILPSLADVSCSWSDTNGIREAKTTVLSTRSGTCTLSLIALAAGTSGAASSNITIYTPTCDSFLADGTPWAKAQGNACPTGSSPTSPAVIGVVNPGPTTCCSTSQATAALQVSVTLPPPGHRQEFREFLFVVNVSYPVGMGPASAKQVQLESTLPALLTPVDTVVVGGATATCPIRGQQLMCTLGDLAQGSSVTLILRVLSKGLPHNVNSTDIVTKVTISCGSGEACTGEGSAAVQIRPAPRELNLAVNANSSVAVGERFSIAMIIRPVKQRTVTNATFIGVIPPTLRAITLFQSISPAAGTCKLTTPQATPSSAGGGTIECKISLLWQQEYIRVRVEAVSAGRGLITGTGEWTSNINGASRTKTDSSEIVTTATMSPQRLGASSVVLGSCCTATACNDGVVEDACSGSWTSNPGMKCGSSFCTGACCSFKRSNDAVCRRTYEWDCLPAGSAWNNKASCFDSNTCPGPQPLGGVAPQATSPCNPKSAPCRPGSSSSSSSSCCAGLACQPAGKDWTGAPQAGPSYACQPANDCSAMGGACGPFPGGAQCCKELGATCIVSSESGVGYCRSRSSCKSSKGSCFKDDDCCGGLACVAGKCEAAKCDLAKACGNADCVARRDQLCAIYDAAAASSPAAE